MPFLKYKYCVANKVHEVKTFRIPKNENAPEHLVMDNKPTVYILQNQTLEDLLKLCSLPVIDPMVIATIFVKFWPETFELNEAWSSFGLPLYQQEEEKKVTHLEDLFEVKLRESDNIEGLPGVSPSIEEVLFLSCMQFRLCNYIGGEYKDYANELRTRMTNLGKNPPYKIQGFTSIHRYDGITEDENLQTIIAGVDMYLMKNVNSRYKLLRMGTISMRLKDMGAWSSLKSMYSYVGDDSRTQDIVFRWLFSASVGAELQGLIEPTQETDKLDSYYPYARAMNLIPSSYASVANNPNMHLIVHIIGTLRGNMRSGNARHVIGANEGSARKLGMWIATGLDCNNDAFMWYRNNNTHEDMERWEATRQDQTNKNIKL